MATIALIVTGDMERLALAESLRRVFPEAEFLESQKVDSFTSAQVSWPPPQRAGLLSNIEKFATALIAALDPARRKPRPDLVVGIDDLELANLEKPEAVIGAFRRAVTAALERRAAATGLRTFNKLCKNVREKCSFHLLVPMCEAYFFADPGALKAAGCKRPAKLIPSCDPEQFTVVDPKYSEVFSGDQQVPKWAIDLPTRLRHPKHYLDFLSGSYRETHQGHAALAVLDWDQVLAMRQHCRFLRSLFRDIEDALGIADSRFPGDTHPLTSDWQNPSRILRNF